MYGTLSGARMFGTQDSRPFGKARIEAFQVELRGLLDAVPSEIVHSFIGQTQLALTMVDEAVRVLETHIGRAEAKGVLRQALRD